MSDLYERIYNAVRKIPKGNVATYTQIAAIVGNPRLCRVVGNALHVNPYFGDVPCHRVVNSKGRLAENFGFGGSAAQAEMLIAECIEVKDGKVELSKYMMKTNSEISIRTAVPLDAKELLKIYAPYVENSVITFEYDIPSVEEFENRIIATLERYPYLVAVSDGEIIGYAYASAFKSRRAYDYSVETTVYVKLGNHKNGVGKLLYTELERVLAKQNITNLNACIAYPGEGSAEFHEKMGYKTVAHFTKCGYKNGKWCDMIWMEKMLSEHEENPKDFIPFSKL